MASSKRVWVSTLIGEDYKKWKEEFVVLDCGTGCGKTYFCINILGKYAECRQKHILYLCNRKKLQQEILDSVDKQKLKRTIRVETYQSLQKKLLDEVGIPC